MAQLSASRLTPTGPDHPERLLIGVDASLSK
jgi:hypothetical protein